MVVLLFFGGGEREEEGGSSSRLIDLIKRKLNCLFFILTKLLKVGRGKG